MTTTTEAEAHSTATAVLLPKRRLWITALGLLLLQATWIWVLPAFNGIDEFDHVYRAEGVARGEWILPPTDATRGTGAMVDVPVDIVKAAYAECHNLGYTKAADCQGTPHGDMTRVATGAGRYPPLAYAVFGYPALPFHGKAADYVMRSANALAFTAVLLLGLFVMRRWATTLWPFAGALVALTPTVLYTSTLAAPNGLEIAAGFAFWMSVLALLLLPGRPTRLVLLAGTLSGVLLVTIRSLGPMWCLLIAVSSLLAVPGSVERVRVLFRDRRILSAFVLVFLATLVSTVWTRTQGALELGRDHSVDHGGWQRVSLLMRMLVQWTFQSVAAFPKRDQPAFPPVYALYFLLGFGLLYLAWRAARKRERRVVAFVGAASLLIPLVITIATINRFATAWQGRYTLPFSMGLMILAGVFLQQSGREPRARHIVTAIVLGVGAHVASVFDVRHKSLASASAVNGLWHAPNLLALALVATLGAVGVWQLVRPIEPVDTAETAA